MASNYLEGKKGFQMIAEILVIHLINILVMAKRKVTLHFLQRLTHSVPSRPNGEEINDSLFFFQEWIEVRTAWLKDQEEHEQICVDTVHTDKSNPVEDMKRAEKLVWAGEAQNEADDFFVRNFVQIKEGIRTQIDFAVAGLTWTLAQDPLFDFFRLAENKGIDKSIEKRMTEELDVEVLRKYLDPRSPSFIEWKYLMAYVTMFTGHHSPAKKLLKNSSVTGDLSQYIPREVEIRRLMDKLCEEEIDKESFDAKIARLCG